MRFADAFRAEAHPDHGHAVSTIVCVNGSLACATDVPLVAVLAREAERTHRD